MSEKNLQRAIDRETATQKYLFGTVVGTQDDGKFTSERPLPGTATTHRGGEVRTYNGTPEGRGDFRGASHLAIHLATMQDNHAKAMGILMQHPSDGSRPTEKMVDTGMGRLSDGVERPVRAYKDERIKLPKQG